MRNLKCEILICSTEVPTKEMAVKRNKDKFKIRHLNCMTFTKKNIIFDGCTTVRKDKENFYMQQSFATQYCVSSTQIYKQNI